MSWKKSAEQAAEDGVIVGIPYTPPSPAGRGTFDVPDYDDVADLQVLFKRFANTAVSSSGDVMTGNYNVVGTLLVNGRPIDPTDTYFTVDKTAPFTFTKDEVLAQARYMCNFSANGQVTVLADATGVPDGGRVTIVQAGKGDVEVVGPNVIGSTRTKSQFQLLEVMYHKGLWWCLAGGGGGGGGEGTPAKPVISFDAGFTKVQWDPVYGSAGPTLAYGALVTPSVEISYRIVGEQLLIDQVTAGTEFTFEVWGVNVAGQGEISDQLTHTWSGVAAPVLEVTSGPAQFVAKWNAIPGVTGYRLAYKKSTDSTWVYVSEDAAATADEVNGLANVQYDVKIQALDAPVASAWSDVVTVTPGPGETTTPTIKHTAYGEWTITNFDAKYLYTVDVTSGTGTVTADKVKLSSVNTQFVLKSQYAAGAPVRSVAGERRAITFHKENRPYVCGSQQCNCRDSCASCGYCGTCCSSNDCSCFSGARSSYGGCGCSCTYCDYNCSTVCDNCPVYCDNYVDVEDAVPAGFVKEFGEWAKTG